LTLASSRLENVGIVILLLSLNNTKKFRSLRKPKQTDFTLEFEMTSTIPVEVTMETEKSTDRLVILFYCYTFSPDNVKHDDGSYKSLERLNKTKQQFFEYNQINTKRKLV